MSDPTLYLQGQLQNILAARGVPGIAAVIVRNGGTTKVSAVAGVRKSDASGASNAILPTDPFGIGSITKPITGYLLTYLIQQQIVPLAWTTAIATVFPELNDASCRLRYAVRTDYLSKTVQDLMSHSALLNYQPMNDYETLVKDAVYNADHVGEYDNAASELHRRFLYAVTSMQDPTGPPGTYSGGSVICGAMMERLTGVRYQQLLQQYVFGPLGMTHSGVGRTCTTATPHPDGVFGHTTSGTGAITPDPNTNNLGRSFNGRSPDGSVFCTADDLGTFMIANLPNSGLPKTVVSNASLVVAQTIDPSSLTSYTRSGWATGPGPQMWHTGDDNRFYSGLRIYPTANYGVAAMTNASGGTELGAAAVGDALTVLENMQANWATLFG